MSDPRLVGSGQLKIDPNRQSDAPAQPQHDNSQGVLERAMANSQGEPELGAQVNRSDERPIGTNLHSDGRVEHVQHNVVEGSTADIQTGSPLFKQILSPTGDQRELIQDMTMESRVTLQNGMEMTARSALEAGFLALDANGTFIPGPVDSNAEPEKDPEKDPEVDAGEFLPDEAEAVMKDLVETTSGQDQVDVIHQMTSGDGAVDPNLISRVASEAGVDPNVIHGKIDNVANAMRAQASAAVAKHGVDPEAVWEYANRPENVGALQAAVRKHTMTRSTKAYSEIANAFILSMDEHHPEAILTADLGPAIKRTFRDEQGAIVIETADGKTFGWKSAIRSGLVKLL